MLSNYTIEVDDVVKSFKIYNDKGTTIKERIVSCNRSRHTKRKVLDGISFKVNRGEAIGLVGCNGCGKSTTLKLLTRIMYPDRGSIKIRGRVSSLLELGAGFHPDMSGRENIYINASIFGLTKKEIDKRIEPIIDFSELKDYIDSPVRTYSSGMYMRLAFSVAINVDADVLLIDEILAVGDANFQAKCFNKLRSIKERGTTIVIVSHSLSQIEQICETSIWLNEGKIKQIGLPRDVHPAYMDFMGHKQQQQIDMESKQAPISELSEQNHTNENSDEVIEVKRWGNGQARIVDIKSYDEKNMERSVFMTGESVVLRIKYEVKEAIYDAVFGIGIFRSDGLSCYGTNTKIDRIEKFNLNKDGEVKIVLKNVNLLSAEYSLDVAIQGPGGISIDYFKEAYKIQVYSMIEDIGIARIGHEWEI